MIKLKNILEAKGMVGTGYEPVDDQPLLQGCNLPRGQKVVLTAEADVPRGLVIELKEKGGYDIYYWYEDPSKKYPAPIKVDGKDSKKDGKTVFIGFHPEKGDDA